MSDECNPEPQPPAKPGLFDIQAKAPPASSGFDFQAKAPELPPSRTTEPILKPAKPPRDAQQFHLLTTRLDVLLAALGAVLVVFLAAYPILNSDIWMHLATGRLIAQGNYTAGVDPFSVASEGVWINHAWLYDWLIYVVYTVLGGPSLVVLKVLVTLALAAVMFRTAAPRAGGNTLLAVFFISLALLVASPRFFLQPTMFSLLFLGVTLLLLREDDSTRRPWLLVPLFILWVNMDGWFLLGTMVVFLVLAGTAIQHFLGNAARPGKMMTLGLVLVVGTVACALNPHHVHAFVLPPELGYLAIQLGDFWPSAFVSAGKAMSELARSDPSLTWSPLGSNHFFSIGHNIAGKAYFLLVFACVASFSLLAYQRSADGLRAFPWARALVCVVFALLAAVLARLVPFFAVVAGPITALNFRDCLAFAYRDTQPTRRGQNLTLLTRGLVAAVFGLLLFLAWPGWLHSYIGDPVAIHRVGWNIEPEPSLVAASEFLKQTAGDGNVFNITPDFNNYLAWFGAPVKGFTDHRFGLFAQGARKHIEMRNALRAEAERQFTGDSDNPATSSSAADWQKFFKDTGITRVGIYNYERDNLARMLVGWMLLRPDQWTLVYGDGRTIIFGLEEPGKPRRFPDARETLARLAFGRDQQNSESSKPILTTFSETGFWTDYAFGRDRPSLPSAKSAFEFDYYQLSVQQWQGPYIQSWRAASWSQVPALGFAAPASVTGPATLTAFLHLPMRVFGLSVGNERRPFLRSKDAAAPAIPVLIVRDALAAARENPKDGRALRLLADGYNLLWQFQEDYWSHYNGAGGPFLRQELRRMQVLGCLQRALAIEPSNPDLHWQLAQKYYDLYLLDAAYVHIRYACDNLHLLARRPFEKEQEFGKRKEAMLQERKLLEKDLTARRDDLDLRTKRANLYQKYRVAVEEPYKILEKGKEFTDERGRGLALTGLGFLQQLIGDAGKFNQLSKVEQTEVGHSLVQINILLGRWQDAKHLLGSLEGSPRYLDFQARLAAASGDYQALEKAVADMDKGIPVDMIRHMFAARVAGLPGAMGIDDLPHSRIGSFYQARLISMAAQQDYYTTMFGAAPLRTLRGVIALDQGDTSRARDFFKQALELAGPQINFVDRRIAERYLDLIGEK